MGFALGFFFLVLLFQHHFIATHQIISQENSLVTGVLHKQPKIHPRVQGKAAVNRRGGGGGDGHGSHGGHGSSGESGHGGDGDKSPQTQGGGSAIPYYAAGAAGGAEANRNKDHHHGSNDANRGHGALNYLLRYILMSLVFV